MTDVPTTWAVVIFRVKVSCITSVNGIILWLLIDDYRTGCWNVSHCQQQQSCSELRSPGRSNSTYLWNDSWVQTCHSYTLLCQIKNIFSIQHSKDEDCNKPFLSCSESLSQIKARLSTKLLISWKVFMFDSHANKAHDHTRRVLHFASFWKWDFGTQKWPIYMKSVSFFWRFDLKTPFRVNVTWDNFPLALDVKRKRGFKLWYKVLYNSFYFVKEPFLWWWSNKGVCFPVPVRLNIHSFLTIFRILFWPSALLSVFSRVC